MCDAGYWIRQARVGHGADKLAGILPDPDVELVLEIGAASSPGPTALRDWTPGAARTRQAFVESAARAYEAGLPVSFEALFAGESRRRISVPIYPFQRKCHWFGPVR